MDINEFQRTSVPETAADNLFQAIQNPNFPLDIEKIALAVGIQEIQEFPDKNLEGMLVATEDKTAGFISVGSFIRELTRRRFTIAHELGHFLITTHKNIQRCTSADLEIFGSGKKSMSMEVEANLFAANLLMPRKVFFEKIRNEDPSGQLFEHLTDFFGSSLTSTLIRYANFSHESVAVVMSENSKIKWAIPSSGFKYYIPSKVPLSEGSMAIEYFQGNEVPDEFEDIGADLWFDTSEIQHHLLLKELAWPMPYYNSVISVLWLEEDEDEIDDFSIEFDGYLKIKE